MFAVTKRKEFSMGHRILGYNGPCGRLHGHNYLVELTVKTKELNELGIAIDFTFIKKILQSTVGQLDHRTVLYKKDPLVEAISAVHKDSVVVFNEQPTAESIARWIYDQIDFSGDASSINIEDTSVKVWETSDSFAVFP